MKKTLKKLLAVLATIALILPTVGCVKDDAGDETVKLKWIMLGPGKQKDSELVWAEFNKKLQDYMPGVTVDFQILNSSEYNEKWQLMMAAKETVDLVWTGYALASFTDEVNKGAFLPLDDLINEYGQDMKKELEDWVFDLGRVGSNIYAIPCYQTMSISPIGLKTRKALSDKYLDVEKLKDTFNAWETDPSKGQEFYDILGDYFQKLKDNGELGSGVGVGSVGEYVHTQKIDNTTVPNFSIDTENMKVVFDYETEDRQLWYKNVNEWYKKGYVRKDILSIQDPVADEVRDGYILWQHPYYNDDTARTDSENHGIDIEVIPLGTDWIIKNSVPATCTSIASTTKNPEKAMQLINLINSEKGKELYNLLIFGIEGTHYEKIAENRVRPFDYALQGEENSTYGLWNWAIGNTLNSWEVESEREGLAEYTKELDGKALKLPTLGFKPDTKAISTELSQISAVITEFRFTLKYGASDNWETVYAQFMDKVEKAGMSKVKENLQKQLDEYMSMN